MDRMMVLVRHGQSEWNLKNLFTGWRDVGLTEQGVAEAREAGRRVKAKSLKFGVTFTSALSRAQRTLDLILDETGQTGLPITRDQALNERDYGDLSGLNKDDARAKWGEEQVHVWRRSYATAPPGGESLRDTGARVWPYYIHNIQPHVMRGEGVLIAAHGNSLRALIMALDGLSGDEVVKLELATGLPILYRLNADTSVAEKVELFRVTVAATPPGRVWYLVSIVIFIAGMAAMVVFLITRLTGFNSGLTRLIVPGEQSLTLDAGTYTIFHEAQSVIDGKIYASPGLGGLAVTVTGPEGGDVPLTASGSGRYTFGGHSGFAVFDFTAPSAGAYVVAGRYDNGAPGPETVLAVGAGFLSSLLWTIFGSLGLAFGGAVIATAIGVTALVKRRRAGLRF